MLKFTKTTNLNVNCIMEKTLNEEKRIHSEERLGFEVYLLHVKSFDSFVCVCVYVCVCVCAPF